MNEMKFLLVETPSKDSIWLHLDTSSYAGVSLWHAGKLACLEHPATWLSPFLWLKPVRALKPKKGIRPFLTKLLAFAYKDARCAVCVKNRHLLAQSMCTLYGYQFLNGAKNMSFNRESTLGRCIVLEHFSRKTYLIGITCQPAATKTVLQ